MRTALTICLLSALLVFAAGCGKASEGLGPEGSGAPEVTPPESAGGGMMDPAGAGTTEMACICAEGKAGGTIWCPDCDVGYVKGEKTTCKGCFTAKNGGPACESCADAD